MSVLSIFVSVVKQALGVPKLLSMGTKRATARLLTAGLHGLGVKTVDIKRQISDLYGEPSSKQMIRTIEGMAERMDLQSSVGAFPDDIAFSRSLMFETSFRKDRQYRYFLHVNITDNQTGQLTSKWTSFYGDKNLTKDEIATLYEQNVLTRQHDARYTLDSYNVFEVWHNQGKKY